MAANAITIVVAAKDQASSVIKDLASNADKNMNSMAQSVETGLKRASVVLAGVGVGLTAYAKTATDYMVQTVSSAKDLARQTGDTIQNASRLDYALQHMGISADQTSVVFNTFSKQISDTNDKSSDAALQQAILTNKIEAAKEQVTALTAEEKKHGDASGELKTKVDSLQLSIEGYQNDLKATATPLDELNVKTKNADGSARAFSDILLDVADRFAAMPDGVAKTNDALQLFGRQGGDMVKILDQGSQGIKDLMEQADKLGITITDKNITAVTAYIQSQKDLQDSTNSLKMQVGELTAPVMSRFNLALTDMISKFISSAGPMSGFLTYALAFGGPFLTAASAVTAFGSNLAGAMPIMAKFAKAGKSVTAAEGLQETAGAAAILPALINPVTVSIVALTAVAGVGYLLWKKHKDATDAAAASLANLSKGGNDYATSMDLVTAAEQRHTHAISEVDAATAHLKQVTDEHKASLDQATQASKNVADAQAAVKKSLEDYGNNSPQYEAAVKNLKDRQDELNGAEYRELELNLQLTPANSDLAKARDILATSTTQLNAAQDYLNNGLDGSLGRIAKFGPTAIDQVDSVGVLQNAVATLAGSWNGFFGGFQSQADYVNIRLVGNTKTAQQLQNTITNINKASGVQFTGGGGSLQGGGGLQGFATGGYTGYGGDNEIAGVVHKGEYVLQKEMVNQQTGTPKSQAGVTFNQYNTINSPIDLDAAMARAGMELSRA